MAVTRTPEHLLSSMEFPQRTRHTLDEVMHHPATHEIITILRGRSAEFGPNQDLAEKILDAAEFRQLTLHFKRVMGDRDYQSVQYVSEPKKERDFRDELLISANYRDSSYPGVVVATSRDSEQGMRTNTEMRLYENNEHKLEMVFFQINYRPVGPYFMDTREIKITDVGEVLVRAKTVGDYLRASRQQAFEHFIWP